MHIGGKFIVGDSLYLCNICLLPGAGAVVPDLVSSAHLTPTDRA